MVDYKNAPCARIKKVHRARPGKVSNGDASLSHCDRKIEDRKIEKVSGKICPEGNLIECRNSNGIAQVDMTEPELIET
jgi:hypothetical protein